ncbi:MAG: hypothetical protein AMXMBFR58_04210 [Phycisphaerae bacterium]
MSQVPVPPASDAGGTPPNPPKRPRAAKVLPTDRIRFEKQLDVLRAYASASGIEGKAVSNSDVAGIVQLTESTVSLGNNFWSDIGLLIRADGGYVPAPEVQAFQKAAEFGSEPAVAALKLGPLLSRSWFYTRLRPKISFRTLTEDEAILELAEEAGAQLSHKPQLRVLLDYLAWSGLIVRDNNAIKLAKPSQESGDSTPSGEHRAARSSATVVVAQQQSEGVVQFQISVKVSMSEIASWDPQRIAAFFSGIAQVMAAKGKSEGADQ